MKRRETNGNKGGRPESTRQTDKVVYLLSLTLIFAFAAADIVVTTDGVKLAGTVTIDSTSGMFGRSVQLVTPDGQSQLFPFADVAELRIESTQRLQELQNALKGSRIPVTLSFAQTSDPAFSELKVGSSPGQYQSPQSAHLGAVRSEMVFEAGKHLESARALAFWSVGTAVAASIASVLLSGNLRIGVPIGLDLVSFVCGLVAWGEVGQAGTMMAWSKEAPGN